MAATRGALRVGRGTGEQASSSLPLCSGLLGSVLALDKPLSKPEMGSGGGDSTGVFVLPSAPQVRAEGSLMGCWGPRGQQALWEFKELRLIQGRERSVQQADLLPLPHYPTRPLFPHSALSVDHQAGQRAEGSRNEPPEPGAALLFMSILCRLSRCCWSESLSPLPGGGGPS